MSNRKYARIFHDAGNFFVWAVMSDEEQVIRRSGISDRNINEFVKVFTDQNYHVSLYTVSNPQYFAETKT